MAARKEKTPKLGTPGFHSGVPETEYHGHQGSLSVSGAKVLLRSPAHFAWEQENKTHKKVFDFGSAAHAHVLGTGMDSIYVAPFDSWRTKQAQLEQDIAREDGLSPILPKDWDVVHAMADKLAEHRMAMRLLSNGEAEVSAFAVDDETGVLRRCRFDWLGSAVLSDYKTAASSDPHEFLRTAVKLKYHMQAAWYLDVAAALGHPAPAFAFIAQEKEPPYVVTVIELPKELIDRGRELNRRALEQFRDCTETGLWPGYVPDNIVATPAAPAWAFRDEEPAA